MIDNLILVLFAVSFLVLVLALYNSIISRNYNFCVSCGGNVQEKNDDLLKSMKQLETLHEFIRLKRLEGKITTYDSNEMLEKIKFVHRAIKKLL